MGSSQSEVAYVLGEFASLYETRADAIETIVHPAHTSLRIISGDRDGSISADVVDRQIYVASTRKSADESHEHWIEVSGNWGRELLTLDRFVLKTYTDPTVRDQMLRQLGRQVDVSSAEQVRAFVDAHEDLIRHFIDSTLWPDEEDPKSTLPERDKG